MVRAHILSTQPNKYLDGLFHAAPSLVTGLVSGLVLLILVMIMLALAAICCYRRYTRIYNLKKKRKEETAAINIYVEVADSNTLNRSSRE